MKHKHTLTKSKTALLVIDVQEKFAPVIPDFDSMVTNVTRLVLTFEMFNLPVVVTEQYPEGLGETVEKIGKLFTMLEVVEKLELAATENGQFMEKINALGCDTFVVCGIETHVCVNQTVLGLLSLGKTVHVVADAVGSRNAIDHSTGLRKMENAGALVTSTETVMFELAERAGTDSFKNIQTMVKAPKTKISQAAPKAAKRAEQPKDGAEKKTVAARTSESKPAPAAAPEAPKGAPAPAAPKSAQAKAAERAPVANAYDDVVDLFELPAAAAEKKPEKAAEEVDLGDLRELAAAAEEKPERETEAVDLADLQEIAAAEKKKPEQKPEVLSVKVKEEIKPAVDGAQKGATHSSSDIDATEAVDIEDMLATIDRKIDAQEPIGATKEEVDRDIADLEDMIKADETIFIKPPGKGAK
jgi:nicotinamidase-related amidase